MRAHKILKSRDGNKNARAFAVFDDSRDVPVVVEQVVSIANLQVLRARGPVIHQNVVGGLHVAAGEKNKSAGNFAEGIAVDAINNFHAAGGIELQESGCDGLHVFEILELVADLDGHGRAAEAEEDGRRGRLQHDVRSDAFDALCGFREQPGCEADNQNNQRHFDGDGDDTDQGPSGPVQQIAENQFTHHGCESLAGCFASAVVLTRTSSEFSGCASWKRSALKLMFKSIFETCRSRR